MGGVQGALREQGRGFAVGATRVPIVPGAILFDLHNGGDKGWGRMPPYWDLGYRAAGAADVAFALGTVGAGFGATTATLKGGLGSASCVTTQGFTVGALAAVNALGQATVGSSPHFWAAPYEREGEFGGLGWPARWPADALSVRTKGDAPVNTTLAIVVTDARLTKAQAKRLAVMAHDGFAHALRPTHASLDGDVVFAASTGTHPTTPTERELTELGALAADCVARAIARGVFEATALPFPGALPSWHDRFGRCEPSS
jgi:L-aminopeptidase/D-esterase-like protein